MKHRSQSGQALVAALIATVIVFALAGALVTAASASLSQQRGATSPLTQDLLNLSGVNAAAAAIAAAPQQCPAGALGLNGELGVPACGRVPFVLPLTAGAGLLAPQGASCASTRLTASGHVTVWVNSPAGGSLYVDGSSSGCGAGSGPCSAVNWPAPQSPLLVVRDCDVNGLPAVYAHLNQVAGPTIVRYSTAAAFIGGPGSPIGISGQVTATAMGRFHTAADGRIDLAVATTGSTEAIVVFRGLGDGRFQPCASIPADNPGGVVAADLNGDGISDLAFTNPDPDDNSVSIYLATGDCTFRQQRRSPIGVGHEPWALVAFQSRSGSNGPSLAVTNREDGTVTILDPDDDGEFGNTTTYSVGGPGTVPTAIVAGQFIGSPRVDLMVANAGSGNLVLLANNGGGGGGNNGGSSFSNAASFPIGGTPNALVTADFGGNGQLDIAVANQNGTLTVLLQGGGGQFTNVGRMTLPGPATGLALGEFNGDTRPDLAVVLGGSSNAAMPLLGNGNGTFTPAVGGAFLPGAGLGGAAAVAAGPITGLAGYQGMVFGGSGWLSVAIHNPQALYSLLVPPGAGRASTDLDLIVNGAGRPELRYEGTLG